MESIRLVLTTTIVRHHWRRIHGVATPVSNLWLMSSSASVNEKRVGTLCKCGLRQSEYEHAIYCKGTNGGQLIVQVYVDDLVIMSTTLGEIKKFKEDMRT
jgi:hypothetical protein